MSSTVKGWGLAILAIILVVGGYQLLHSGKVGGAINCNFQTCYSSIGVDGSQGTSQINGGLITGSTGNQIDTLKTGSCTIWTNSQTIAATSTQQAVCQSATDGTIGALTGVTTDGVCSLINASSTNTTVGGLVVEGSSASSTAGTIVARLANLTGTTFTWTAAASSSAQWNYVCYDPH